MESNRFVMECIHNSNDMNYVYNTAINYVRNIDINLRLNLEYKINYKDIIIIFVNICYNEKEIY